MQILTLELLEEMPPRKIIACGIVENGPRVYQINMVSGDIGRQLFWIAKRGDGAADWAIYTEWLLTQRAWDTNKHGTDHIGPSIVETLRFGQKVLSRNNVATLVPHDEAAWRAYRQ